MHAPLGRLLALLLVYSASPVALLLAEEPLPDEVLFNRDIRPILSDACFHCHGPDAARRKADLRLDLEEAVREERDSGPLLVAGRPADSVLYARLTADDESRMPPRESGRVLTARQIALMERWIRQGAAWQKHWSLMPPVRPAVPKVEHAELVVNPIDAFVLERLEREGLQFAPEAERPVLLRRLSLDLTGLPPTPEEVDAFVSDGSPEAYERVVDRLLASPRFGERMAVRWLDAARYADTSGYQSDGERSMWRWRDWVIEAYNRNLPFDQFTIEQLAGDMLPSPTLDQRIATGFNRNHRGNAEGGIIPEEYAVEYVVDRVDTTFTVWLGLTMGCARCHDHKYDPITQREYYQVFALFNNVPEKGRAIKFGNSPPMIKAPTREQQVRLEELEQALAKAREAWAAAQPQLERAQAEWEQSSPVIADADWAPADALQAHFPLDTVPAAPAPVPAPASGTDQPSSAPSRSGSAEHKSGGGKAGGGKSGETLANGETGGVLSGAPAERVAGVVGHALAFHGETTIEAAAVGQFGYLDRFTVSAWVRPSEVRTGTLVSRMADQEEGEGWSIALRDGKLQVHLTKRWLDDALRIETDQPLRADQWQHIAVTYDGSRAAAGVAVFVDGARVSQTTLLDELNQTFATKHPLRIGGGNGPAGRFRGAIDDVRIATGVLSPEALLALSSADPLPKILARSAAERSAAERARLRAYFLARHAPPELRALHEQLQSAARAHAAFEDVLPTVMVMQELSQPRPAHVLLRGEYDKPGEAVVPGVPAALNHAAARGVTNRLELARWLVDPQHPLTARVAVNRFWQQLFGNGLVKTVEDLGSQGEWPTHPELLDWLAVEFSQPAWRPAPEDSPLTAWDTKRLLKLLVTSRAYRQSSRVSALLLQRDPDNRLFARGPRLRLSAEMIRDQALAASGLLVEQRGGPSVKPYQPAGLYQELQGTEEYVQDHGPALYRRGLYTYWKRTIAPPMLVTFDAAGRETCMVRESRTNTPLQALTLLNETTFVEAARKLAERTLREAGPATPDRLAHAFRLVLARTPEPREVAVLQRAHDRAAARYRADLKAAEALLAVGEAPRDPELDPVETAALAVIGNLLLSLDEAVTKE